jgi:hypothetical protein
MRALLSGDTVVPTPGKRKEQRGAGAYTLCKPCNDFTGGSYGRAYADWATQCAYAIGRLKVTQGGMFPLRIYPLRVVKQIIAMFFSANPDGLGEHHNYLVKFVLDRSLMHLPPDVAVHCFLTGSHWTRQSAVVGQMDLRTGRNHVYSEITFAPVGLILSRRSNSPDPRLCAITWFSDFAYDQETLIYVKLWNLGVETVVPGDFRTKEEIAAESPQP